MYSIESEKNVVVLVRVTHLDAKTRDVVGKQYTLSSSIKTAIGNRGSFCP